MIDELSGDVATIDQTELAACTTMTRNPDAKWQVITTCSSEHTYTSDGRTRKSGVAPLKGANGTVPKPGLSLPPGTFILAKTTYISGQFQIGEAARTSQSLQEKLNMINIILRSHVWV